MGTPFLSCRGDPPTNDNTKVTLGLAGELYSGVDKVTRSSLKGVFKQEPYFSELGGFKSFKRSFSLEHNNLLAINLAIRAAFETAILSV